MLMVVVGLFFVVGGVLAFVVCYRDCTNNLLFVMKDKISGIRAEEIRAQGKVLG